MATEEWVKRAILGNKQYDDLPQRVRAVLPVSEYKAKYEHPLSRWLAVPSRVRLVKSWPA